MADANLVLAGVDGCKGGWLCIQQESSGALISTIYPDAQALLGQQPRPAILCIDIPIGLLECGTRECDREARRMLGARACCVFSSPLRPVLAANSYPDASRIRTEIEGKGMSQQSWAIVPKIREVDVAMRQAATDSRWVREVHPEVCFCVWNGGVPMSERKKSKQGRHERRLLIDRVFGPFAADAIRAAHPQNQVATDDIHDAFAALWTAHRIAAGTAISLPQQVPLDSFGLPMEMWA